MSEENEILENLDSLLISDKFSEYKATCKYCGASRLRWEDTGEGWKLMELDINLKEVPHKCKNER